MMDSDYVVGGKKLPEKVVASPKIFDTIYRILAYKVSMGLFWVSSFFILLMMLLTFIVVVIRKTPLSGGFLAGSTDLAEIFFAMMVVTAISYTWFVKGHLVIDLIPSRFPPRGKAIVDAIGALVGLIWVCLLVWAFWGIDARGLEAHTYSTILQLPIYPFQIIYTIVMAHFGVVLLGSLVTFIANATGHPWKTYIPGKY